MWAKMLNNLDWVLGIDNRVTRKAVPWIALILACRIPQFIMMWGRIWLATEACPRPNEVIKYTPWCWGSTLPFFFFFLPGSTVLWGNVFFPPPFFLPPFLIEHVETNQRGFYEFIMWSYIQKCNFMKDTWENSPETTSVFSVCVVLTPKSQKELCKSGKHTCKISPECNLNSVILHLLGLFWVLL